ncbi:MAG: hypothetical protein AOY29_06890 [Alcanivorax borkumensis]|uniref:DSP-PTPase phosphatase fused to NAD+ Kinase domain-containing protein n=1 Tax=Alcanivorax borkumensis (strain ATCC 700651 / DSM 11573 / NCIMB 13689 / SK2) TaxID=393595 RepID=Q0VSB3_ALCBS|nr:MULTISPECIES: tyrosine-protein phosphatase [Alcanivorax]EUC70190.1 hypothetical protein Y017_11085 [Alcanivorax sp. 97CO-5]OJH06495.1 MAG: hypothetical protein AOY29_06890 [Alcanivorax borkumensis]BAP13353.1 hypothetical protein AS19_05020 [Alcanivorax sp. NBRC 101098]CAL15935.1 conserved hypothetical protein [Alcanivorax borkumensis SK2]
MLLYIAIVISVLALVIYRYRKLMYHFRVVERRKLYRSGTLGPIGIRIMHRILGVNTIVNLRLESEYSKNGWYFKQLDYCRRHGVKLVNIPMAQDTPPTEAQIVAFIEELGRADSRCLVHCEMGVIRTGMMVVAVATRCYGVTEMAVWQHFPLYGHKLDRRRQKVREFIQLCGRAHKASA